MQRSTPRINPSRGTLTENAFFALEAMECDNMLRENISPVVLNLPDSDDDDDDFEQPSAPTSATKSRPSSTKRRQSASQLRDDRASMTKQSGGKPHRRPLSKQKLGSTAKRKLDFSSQPKASLKYCSDNSELSGTEEDEIYKPSQVSPRDASSSSNDDALESPKRRRPRLSTISLITPSNRGDNPRSSVARRIPARNPRRTPINFDMDDSSDNDDEDLPLSSLKRKRRARARSTTNSPNKKWKMSGNVEIVDLVGTPPRKTSRVNLSSPLGIVEVKSSLYPLPVVTPSPLPKKRQPAAGSSSLKRRRVRKILESDDEDSAKDERAQSRREILHQTPVICERPTPPVAPEPSKSARELMDRAGDTGGTGMEWYQERCIDEFSDSDSASITKRTDPVKKRKLSKPIPAPSSLNIFLGKGDSPNFVSPKKNSNLNKPRKLGSFASLGRSIVLAKNEATPPRPRSTKNSSKAAGASFRQSVFVSRSNNQDTLEQPSKVQKPAKKRNARPSSSSGKDSIIIYSDDDDDLVFPVTKASSKPDSIQYVPSSEDDILNDNSNASNLASNESVDEGPPPFRLEMLCEQGESIMDMIQRLGEDEVLDKIEDAQNDGRTVIGAEELGISSQPPKTSAEVNRLRDAVQATGKKKRANSYDPEKAMNGEYTFNYRGKKSENNKPNSRRGKYGRKGRRGRGGGRAR